MNNQKETKNSLTPTFDKWGRALQEKFTTANLKKAALMLAVYVVADAIFRYGSRVQDCRSCSSDNPKIFFYAAALTGLTLWIWHKTSKRLNL